MAIKNIYIVKLYSNSYVLNMKKDRIYYFTEKFIAQISESINWRSETLFWGFGRFFSRFSKGLVSFLAILKRVFLINLP